MADKSAIEWTDATWNPIVGCSVLTPGCTNCYAMKMAARIETMKSSHYDGTTKKVNGNAVWTGKMALAPEHILLQPLKWKRGRRIFVNSMGDLFHESIPDEWIDRVFAIMALSPRHTFQVLTKRAERMRDYMLSNRPVLREMEFVKYGAIVGANLSLHWPLPNVWLGVSTERQKESDERIPLLLQTPAAMRFISAEPLLDHIRLHERLGDDWLASGLSGERRGLDWVIVGGESGSRARPMHPDWARTLRDQCASAGVPYFFKQWGAYSPSISGIALAPDGSSPGPDKWNDASTAWCDRVGKKSAGRLLDGREHNAFPAAAKAQAA